MDAHPELAVPIAILGFTLAIVLVCLVIRALLIWDDDRHRAKWAGRRARIEADRTRRFAEYVTENYGWPTMPIPADVVARVATELSVQTDRFERDLLRAQDAVLGGR